MKNIDDKSKLKKKLPIRLKIKIIMAVLGVAFLLTHHQISRQACACVPSGYVAHFTEQEAIDIIRVQLEAAGLNFDSVVPSYTVESLGGGNRWNGNVGIDLFDEQRSVAITLINTYENTTSSIIDQVGNIAYHWNANHIETEFSEQYEGIFFGVFYNSSSIREWQDQNRRSRRPHTVEEIEFLTELLETQVQDFIEQLRAEGIID